MRRHLEIKQNSGSSIPFLTTFIKKIQLSNDKNQKVVLIDNFARVAQTKNLVFDFIEMRNRFNATGQGRVQRTLPKNDSHKNDVFRFGPLQEHFLNFQGNNMLIFQSFRLGDSYQVNIEVSIEVCSDSVHCFRNFMSSTQAKSI